jgi:hypothetical protein
VVGGEFRVRVWGSKQGATEVGGVVFRVLAMPRDALISKNLLLLFLLVVVLLFARSYLLVRGGGGERERSVDIDEACTP